MSSWNDSQAVTLEVSNSYAGGEWPVGDAAWDATTSLLADVCKRWGIDPYYDGTIYATFTEHRMFAATGCPGDYIHRRMEMLIEEVRSKMNGTGGKWVEDEKGWWYERSDGSYPKDKWEKIEGEYYCFDSEGYMMMGWIWWAGSWYYCKKSKPGEGKMLTGWQTIKWKGKSCRFYFDNTGAMYPGGFKKIKGKWYAFDENGVLVKDDAEIVVGKGGVVTIL